MKRTIITSIAFAAAGLTLAAVAVALSLTRLWAAPVLISVPEDAAQCAQDLMDAVSRGDYEAAGELFYGTPDLGADRQPADEVGQMIWKAYEKSFSYEFVGEFYATDTGVARDVSITALELASVTENLKQRSQDLLERRMEKADDVSQIYDENNEYREDFVMNVLFDAVYQSLQEDTRLATETVTLNLVYRRGQWWVMPDASLLSAISGGIAG